jgi:hydroxymethylglutaryl-CoA lyase
MQYCLSVSPAHNRANIGRDPEDSMSALPEVLEIAGSNGADVQLCLATAFTCPFTGDVDPRAVLELVDDPRAVGVTDVVICDTIGQATPDRVADLVGTVSDRGDGRGLVFHGHDTWGLGVANAIAAVSAGATTIDGSLGGLGGCPFAPGASGNTATEDLVFALRPDWLSPQVFADLVRLGQSVVTAAGETSASRAEKASRLTPATFPWALAAHPSAAR